MCRQWIGNDKYIFKEGENELRFHYLSLLLTGGHELNLDHQLLFSTPAERLWHQLCHQKHPKFTSRC